MISSLGVSYVKFIQKEPTDIPLNHV